MDKWGVGVIALAIIAGFFILGGAIVMGSFIMFMGSAGIVTVDNESVVDMNSYLTPLTGSEVKDYQSSCTELDNSTISTVSMGDRVKVQGKIISILSNESYGSNVLVQVPGISKYSFLAVTYGSSMPYNVGESVYIYGEYADLGSVPDPDSGEYTMVPMIRSVYLQKY